MRFYQNSFEVLIVEKDLLLKYSYRELFDK
jgi:hypothetical protein